MFKRQLSMRLLLTTISFLFLVVAVVAAAPFAGVVLPTASGGGSAILVGTRNLKNWDSGSTPTGFYQTLEQCFASGVVPSGNIAEPRKGDGVTVMTNWQADNRIAWGNGSLRCARYTFKYPSQLAASGTDTLKFYSKVGSWNNTPWATASTVIAAQDFKLEVVMSATTYTCGVNNEITRGNTYQFDAGPTAVGLVIHGVFRNGTGGSSTDQGALQCRIYVVAFEDGTFKVWGRADSCRPSNATCAAVTATAALKNGASSLWTASSFTFYGGTFFVAADTDGQPYYSGTTVKKVVAAFPQSVLANPETTNLYDARLMPFYKVSVGAIALMNTAPNSITYTPVGMGDYTGKNFNDTGNSAWIGPMPFVSAVAMNVGDWTSLRQDAIDALAQGAQQWHFRDSTNGNILNLNGAATYSGFTQNTSVSWSIGSTITLSGGSPYGASQVADASHIPSFAQFQLYYSGEEWWLDQYQDEVVGIIGGINPGEACYARAPLFNTKWWAFGGGQGQQVRSTAWQMRDLQNASWLTPTGHPAYQYMLDLIAQNWGAGEDYLNGPYANMGGCSWASDWAPLGYYVSVYGNGNNLQAPWMYDYWAVQASLALLRGQVSSSNLMITRTLTLFTIGRSVNGCAYAAAPYNMNVGANNLPGLSPPWATTWSQVYAGIAVSPGVDNTITGGPLTNIAGSGCPGSGVALSEAGYESFLPGNYPNYLLGAAIMAKAAGITGASSVATYYLAALAALGGFADADQANFPQFMIAEPQ